MDIKKESHRKKRSIATIDRMLPGNLKFGVIVAVAIIWAQLLRSILEYIFSLFTFSAPILADFLVAVIATALGFLILLDYRKIWYRIKKVKV
jgi:hypothetical protein